MRKYKKYVIGFDRDDQVIYGDEEPLQIKYATPMTKTKAIQEFKDMIESNSNYRHSKIVIYELVPVKEENK